MVFILVGGIGHQKYFLIIPEGIAFIMFVILGAVLRAHFIRHRWDYEGKDRD